jgi:hypothetical protein
MLKNLKEIIIFVLVIIALGIAAWCFLLKKSNLEERLVQEDFLFREKVVVKKSQEKLSRTQDEIRGLSKVIEGMIQRAASLESDLLASRQELELAKKQLQDIESSNSLIMREIAQADANINNLKNRIAYMAKEALKVDERLSLLLKTRDALAEQLKEYAQKSSGAIVSARRESALQKDGFQPDQQEILDESDFVTGEVLTVNREFAFLVVNLGKSNGITEGMRLNIRRDNRNLAHVKVETVREHISAAALIDKENLSQIRAGDTVLVMDSTYGIKN